MTQKLCLDIRNKLWQQSEAKSRRLFHRFQSNRGRRARWLSVFGMNESQLRVAVASSKHLPDCDANGHCKYKLLF